MLCSPEFADWEGAADRSIRMQVLDTFKELEAEVVEDISIILESRALTLIQNNILLYKLIENHDLNELCLIISQFKFEFVW